MQVVIRVDVIFPWDVFNLKDRLGNTTYKALLINLCLHFSFLTSLVGERINNNTKEDIHEDNIDDHEKEEIEDVSGYVVFTAPLLLGEDVSKTTTSSNTILHSRTQTLNKRLTVHIIIRCMITIIITWTSSKILKVRSEVLEGEESTDV